MVNGCDESTKGNKIVRNYCIAAMFAGLIPVPVIDCLVIILIIYTMTYFLQKEFELDFAHKKIKLFVLSVAAGMAAVLTAHLLGPFVKHVPAIGTVLGVITLPLIAGFLTLILFRFLINRSEVEVENA